MAKKGKKRFGKKHRKGASKGTVANLINGDGSIFADREKTQITGFVNYIVGAGSTGYTNFAVNGYLTNSVYYGSSQQLNFVNGLTELKKIYATYRPFAMAIEAEFCNLGTVPIRVDTFPRLGGVSAGYTMSYPADNTVEFPTQPRSRTFTLNASGVAGNIQKKRYRVRMSELVAWKPEMRADTTYEGNLNTAAAPAHYMAEEFQITNMDGSSTTCRVAVNLKVVLYCNVYNRILQSA